MSVLLFFFALAAAGLGGLILVASKSAIHEIESLILFLIGAVFLVGTAIVDAVKRANPK
jgi:uncharacterized membrane protein